MKYCVQCRQEWADSFQYCPNDATRLQTSPPDPLLGKCLGNKYEVVEVAGRGRHGTLYRARHRYAEQTCAIRLLNPELTHDAEQIQRLRIVFRTGLNWQSPYAVRLYDLDSAEGVGYFLVEEWVEGPSLQTLLQNQGRLPGPVCASLAGQVCEALVEAHSKDVRHGCLSASDVIVSGSFPALTARVSATGLGWVAAGTDSGDDLTMLGALLFRMLTGEEPFALTGEDRSPKMRAATELKEAWRRANAPAELAAIAGALLGIGPGRRLRTAAEALSALREAAGSQAIPPEAPPPELQAAIAEPTITREPPRPPAWSHADSSQETELFTPLEKLGGPWRRRAIVAGLVIVLGAGLFWLLRTRSVSRPRAADTTAAQPASSTVVPAFDYEVVSRPGEGEPGHHSHLLVRIQGVPVYIIRDRGSYPSTNARAEAVAQALRQAGQKLKQTPAPRFGFRDENGVTTIVLEGAQGIKQLPVIDITRADVQGYNAYSRRKITQSDLAEWWLARTVDYLGLFVLGEKPRLTIKTEDGAVLERLYESARSSNPDSPRIRAAALSQALSKLDAQSRELLQNSVFQYPGKSTVASR
jgi:tRNA A-37 threonylcarbamoyl transferase component Bud32